MDFLTDWIISFGVVAIAIVIFAESGLLIGFFLPGDSLLFTAGYLAGGGALEFNIHLLAVIMFAAAALGDSTGYTFGARVGKRLFKRRDSLLFQKDNLRRAEEFFDKYGAKTILLARFVPVIRTFAPIVAGAGSMRYRTFIIYNLIGALIWAVGLTYLGYYLGNWIRSTGINIELVLILIVFLSILPPLYHVAKSPAAKRKINNLKNKLLK